MTEPLRRIGGDFPPAPDPVDPIRRVRERPRREPRDEERERPADERPPQRRPDGPDADGHVDVLA